MTSDLIPTKPKSVFRMSDSVYDFLSSLVKYILPALGTLYFTLAQIWGLPYGEQVVGTIVAVTTAIGIMIGISKKNYDNEPYQFDGEIIVDTDASGNSDLTLAAGLPVDAMREKGVVIMNVRDINGVG